jgi:adenine phosphoribosyltransferase
LANEYVQEGSVNIYLNGVTPSDRVILIDDLISTGGTLVALVKAIREAGAQILEILTIGEKEENHGRRHLLEETGVPLKTMLVTTLTPSEIGFRSRVVQVHLGDMPAVLAEAVSEHFPAGFCRLGSGEPRS